MGTWIWREILKDSWERKNFDGICETFNKIASAINEMNWSSMAARGPAHCTGAGLFFGQALSRSHVLISHPLRIKISVGCSTKKMIDLCEECDEPETDDALYAGRKTEV